MSTDPDFALAKEFIVQGLACKLGGSDQFNSEDLKINVNPRKAYTLLKQTLSDDEAQAVEPDGSEVLSRKSMTKSGSATRLQAVRTMKPTVGPLQDLANQSKVSAHKNPMSTMSKSANVVNMMQ